MGAIGEAGLAAPAARAAQVLHDLRAPLTVIRGQCFTLLRGEPRPDRRRRLAVIEGEVDRLARALEGLLAPAPATAPPPALVDLADLAADAAERHAGAAARAGVRIEVWRSGRPARVAADPDLIRRALDNLIANAIRHSPPGGRVRVAASRRGGTAHVRVRDEGEGVHADDRERIFLAGERGRAPRGDGLGLGLSIAREIAEAHGGRLALDPLGPGATFRLSLPIGGEGPGRRGAA
jgi:signal transduction histidine kinase